MVVKKRVIQIKKPWLMYFFPYIDEDLSLLERSNLCTTLGQRKHGIRWARFGGNPPLKRASQAGILT